MKSREELIRLNRENAEAKGCPIFWSDKCYYCGYDLVKHYGDDYATALITGCKKCHHSFVD